MQRNENRERWCGQFRSNFVPARFSLLSHGCWRLVGVQNLYFFSFFPPKLPEAVCDSDSGLTPLSPPLHTTKQSSSFRRQSYLWPRPKKHSNCPKLTRKTGFGLFCSFKANDPLPWEDWNSKCPLCDKRWAVIRWPVGLQTLLMGNAASGGLIQALDSTGAFI